MPSPTASADNKLTSDRFEEFTDALEILYIRNNISGRNQFTIAWPDVALHIFGEELMAFDREGTAEKERRAALEEEAEDRRLALLEILSAVEAKSVKEGALQLEYVQGVLAQLGRGIALLVYGRWLVDRFLPPPPGEASAAASVPAAAAPRAPMPVAAPSADSPADPMDRIKPISVEPAEPAPPLPPATPVVPAAPPPAEKEEQLIVDTQGGGDIRLPEAPRQESLAPVMGGGRPGGLKIFGIADAEAPGEKKTEDENPEEENPDENNQ